MPDIDYNSNPRFQEWLLEQKSLQESGVPPHQCLPFLVWLKNRQDQEREARAKQELERNRPQIRSDNPPAENVRAAANYDYQSSSRRFAAYLSIGICILLVLLIKVFDSSSTWPLLIVIISFACTAFFLNASEEAKKNAVESRQLFPLHVYKRGFTAILADGSPLRITLWFSVPANRTEVTNQLDEVAHRELLLFMKNHKARPDDSLIIQELRHRLVPFQESSHLRILDVNVTPNPADNSGYISHLVSTPIGVITYAYKPLAEGLPDIFFEAETDKALLRLIRNNPETDLRTHQSSLRINIIHIEPRSSGEGGYSSPVGNPL